METLELPVLEEVEKSSWREHDIGLTAFRIWREASRLDNGIDEDPQAPE